MITLLPMLLLVIFLMVGIPIAFALAGAGFLGVWIVTGNIGGAFAVLVTAPFSTVGQFALSTIPMFILMAYFSSLGGLANDLYDAAAKWLSNVRGGLAIATVFACGIFGAMSGASVAAASVMAKIAMPNMRRFGYSESLAAGAICVGSTLDVLIPPSIAMVIYGIITGTSISKLLIAGVMPGLVLGIILSVVILVWVKLRPHHAPKTYQVSWRDRCKSLSHVWPGLLLILLVLGFLYMGIATPTEVGAIGAALSALIGVAMRRLSREGVSESLRSTIRTSTMIFMILLGGTIFGYYMAMSQIPQQIVRLITELNLNRWVVVVAIMAGYFLISMFMDEVPLMLITVQLTFPLVTALQFDPIWYGVIMVLLGAMGLVFPPVGMIVFVVCSTAKVDLVSAYKGTSIMIIALILTALLLMLFPGIATWLPTRMH